MSVALVITQAHIFLKCELTTNFQFNLSNAVVTKISSVHQTGKSNAQSNQSNIMQSLKDPPSTVKVSKKKLTAEVFTTVEHAYSLSFKFMHRSWEALCCGIVCASNNHVNAVLPF